MTKKPAKPRMPWPVLLLITGIITPVELSPVIGTLHLLPHRCAILVFILPALIKLISSKGMRLRSFDIFFILYNCWILFVFPLHLEFSAALQTGGSLAVESLGGYLIARVYIRDYDTFMATLRGLFLSVMFVGLLALPETLTGFHFVHLWLRGLGGVDAVANDEVRWGLHRSYATFNHPILYGAYCASILSMVWFTTEPGAKRFAKAAGLVTATFFGLSSAPLNTLAVQSLLGGLHRATKRVPNRMKIAGGLFFLLYMYLTLFTSQSPLAAIVTRISIDPETAYYRTLIWGFGMDNVWAHPWIGLGLDDWVRPHWMPSTSVDAYWLIVTMQMGIPAIVLLVTAIWLLIASVHARGPGQRPRQEQKASVGWTLSFVALALAGFTVHYWDATHTYLFFLLGMGGWLADPVKAKKKVNVAAKAVLPPAVELWPEPTFASRYVASLDPMAAR